VGSLLFLNRKTEKPKTAGLISSVLANEHGPFFTGKLSEAKGMFTQRLYRSLGLAAHLGWARLLVDRYRDMFEVPAPTREGHGGRHHFTPDDEGAFEYGNYQSPATPTSVVGDLCFDACFSQLDVEPEPPSGGQTKTEIPPKPTSKDHSYRQLKQATPPPSLRSACRSWAVFVSRRVCGFSCGFSVGSLVVRSFGFPLRGFSAVSLGFFSVVSLLFSYRRYCLYGEWEMETAMHILSALQR
jgi:hypothetical protein